jgi:hypothetical protein
MSPSRRLIDGTGAFNRHSRTQNKSENHHQAEFWCCEDKEPKNNRG